MNRQSWDDLVFRGRNQDYGAYQVRIASRRAATKSLFAMLSAVVLFVGWIYLKSFNDDLQVIVPDGPPVFVPPEVVSPPTEEPEKVEEEPKPKQKSRSEEIQITHNSSIVPPINTPPPTPDPIAATRDTLPSVDKKEDAGAKIDSAHVSILAENRDPAFPGGMDSLMKYFQISISNPAKIKKVYTELEVQFTIDTSGKITQINVGANGFPWYRQLVKTALEKMPPWSPGIKEGHPFEARMTLPVSFYPKLKPNL